MDCVNCSNKNNYKIVKKNSLCIECHNNDCWSKGEKLLCNNCFKTSLRLCNNMRCDVCNETERDLENLIMNYFDTIQNSY